MREQIWLASSQPAVTIDKFFRRVTGKDDNKCRPHSDEIWELIFLASFKTPVLQF
jgi:hypothetical protein